MNKLCNKLVSALGKCTSVDQANRWHAHIVVSGLDQNCVVLAKLVRKLTELRDPMENYARLVFDRVQNPNPFLWTALIRGYALQGSVSESGRVYSSMRMAGSSPLSFTFSALLKGSIGTGNLDLGREFHAQIVLLGGFGSDLYVGNALIEMYAKCGSVESAHKVFDEMTDRDVVTWTELIVAYGKSGDMDTALKLFGAAPAKDDVAWTAMITGYVQNARPREALAAFDQMQSTGVEIDGFSLAGAVSACAMLGASSYADRLRIIAETSGLGPREDAFVGSAMVDMYAKCGSLAGAASVFASMKDKNVASYGAMIAAAASHGDATSAVMLFHAMLKSGITPNHAILVALLAALSHAGKVETGRRVFAAMERSYYGVAPSLELYSCQVDLLGRAGLLDEALGVVESMPMEPNGVVWGALLAACRAHGEPDLARFAADRLFELEPGGAGNYALLANTYASAGMYEKALSVRTTAREKGVAKMSPGMSWVEASGGKVHEFVAGDTSHPISGDIRRALEDLRRDLDEYEPDSSDVASDVSDEEKQLLLMSHSEKLALAYGLIKEPRGRVIRIMKNLRICRDCHAFIRGASRVTGREIIVRDNMRFHRFRNGVCSCGEYW